MEWLMSVLLVAAAVAADTPSALPEELSHLAPLAADETKLVDAARAFDRAQTLLAEGEFAEAKAKAKAGDKEAAKELEKQVAHRFEMIKQGYEFVLQRYPNNARAQTYYGEVLYDRFGQAENALKAWNLAVSLDPKCGVAWNDLGIHYSHEGNYERALDCYDKALAIEPDQPDYLFNLAQMYLLNVPDVLKLRKWEKPKLYREAMKLSKKAARIAPNDFDLVRDYALNFFACDNFDVDGNWKDAARAWQKAREAARTDDERFNAWLYEARAWIRKGDETSARACLSEALKLNPTSPVARQLLEELGKGKQEKPASKKFMGTPAP